MGFFNVLDELLDEKSDNSFEKKLGRALDKAEAGIKKLENASDTVDGTAKKAVDIIDKTDNTINQVKTD